LAKPEQEIFDLCKYFSAAERPLNLAVGFNPRWAWIFFRVARATIEFSRRSRDAVIFSDHPVG